MTATRVRRPPPPFRTVTVEDTELLHPRLMRVTLGGRELDGFAVSEPGASVRLLLPSPGSDLVVPEWNGNEFLLPDGRRPVIRTLTPGPVGSSGELVVDVVLHGDGALSTWATGAAPGAAIAASGPGRGYVIDPEAPAFLLVGDETAVPAIAQLLESIPPDRVVEVHVEIVGDEAGRTLPRHPHAAVEWHELSPGRTHGDELVDAVQRASLPAHGRVWAAGEAAAMQRIRRHLFDERGVPRAHTTIRGYWKHGRRGDSDVS